MRVLVVDLNNFSRYPTLAVGLIVAVLRSAGVEVDVLSPLARGVKGYPRLTRATPWGLIDSQLRYWSAVTPSRVVRRLRGVAARAIRPGSDGDREQILAYFSEFLCRSVDVVLVSAYTMYENVAAAIADVCRTRGIPVIVGGNYFVAPEIVDRWLGHAGITAIYGGEPERTLVSLIRDLTRGADVSGYAGVSVAAGARSSPAAPLTDLDGLPFPDYTDFPWSRYPNRIVPIMTGRGCEWGKCRFCGDVVTSAGRTFRSRSLANVLDEIRLQAERHHASLFAFLDLKLNSNVQLWRGLIEQLPVTAPGAAWTASVHVDTRTDNGLSRKDLAQARRAGLARVTTGLETASARLLKRMAKGTRPERTSTFVRDAAEAGISVRLTTIIGYPGELPDDIEDTARFLAEHERWIERVMINRFALMLGAEDDRRSRARPGSLPGMRRGALDFASATFEHCNPMWETPAHRKAVFRLMAAAHRINRKRLMASAQEFEGVM